MGNEIADLSGKLGLDTTDFVTAVNAANRQLRVIESGFRASAAALGDWSKDATGLESRIGTLTEAMEIQALKVKALKAEYERLASSGEASTTALQNLQIKINKEAEALGKMEHELRTSEQALQGMGKESQEAGGKVKDLGKNSEDAGEKVSKFSKIAAGLETVLKGSIAAVAALAGAVAGVGGAITGLVMQTADAAGELVDMSTKTGIGVERLQELTYVGDQVGTSVDVMTGSLSKLTKAMAGAAASADSDAGKAFTALGVSVTDANGQLRDSETVFADAIDALGAVENETERDALAMALFGKSAMELNPLIKAGADEIARLSQEAHEVGAVMDTETVGAFEGFGDTLASLQAGLKGTLGTLAGAFLPGFQALADQGGQYLREFADIVRSSNGDLGQMAQGIGQLVGRIATDIASQGPKLLEAGLGIVQGIINSMVASLPVMLPAVIQMLTTLVTFIVENLPLLIKAAVEIILALANGLAVAIPQLLPVIAEVIPQIVLALIEALPQLIEAALAIILALANGLIAAIPVLIPYIPTIVQAIATALIEALPKIVEAALLLVITLAKGIVDNLPVVLKAAQDIIKTILSGAQQLNGRLMELGGNIVKGIWSGMSALSGWWRDQVMGFFSGIVADVKSALGIHSPSAVFAGIGENMALGLGRGFDQAFGAIERGVTGAVDGLAVAATGADVPRQAAAGGSNRTITLGGIHVYIPAGDPRPEETGRRAGEAAGNALLQKLQSVGA